MAPAEGGRPTGGKQHREGGTVFADPSMKAYMAIRDTAELPHPKYLLRLTERMHANRNPLVQLAAGWSAAEYALIPGAAEGGSITLRNRLSALQKAAQYWANAAEGFVGQIEEAEDDKAKYGNFSRYVGTLHALNTLPAMSVVASLQSGEPLPDHVRDERIQATVSQTAAIAKIVYDLDFKSEEFDISRKGLGFKLLSSLLLQSSQPYEFAFFPAPLRLELHEDRGQRVHLLAEPLSPLYRRGQILVTNHPEIPIREDPRFVIVPDQDLQVPQRRSPFFTLGTFLRMHNGLETWPNSRKDLSQTTESLRKKFLWKSRIDRSQPSQ